MHNAAQAYHQTAKITSEPRELESSLLLRAASQLQDIKDNWDERQDQIDQVLMFNRKLWTIIVTSATDETNPLPQEIKNNIGSLAAFIFGQTLRVQARPEPEKLNSLISINRNIAAGLA
ncbi:MAG: hypothetical protein C0605_01325 [Hyphomicrobiales bacterium]|nr:MAG: hypothetical protein C0605_01325 [Hyphomicrobiales bacterium]